MQHNNTIEDKLKAMEAMAQPDCSHMDAHWKEMAAVLQPAVVPVKRAWPKWLLNAIPAAGVVLLLAVAIWYVRSHDGSGRIGETVSSKPAEEKSNTSTIAVSPVVNTIAAVTPSAHAVTGKPAIDYSLVYGSGNGAAELLSAADSVIGGIKLSYTDCAACGDKVKNTVTGNTDSSQDASISNQLLLQTFFSALQPREQQFGINTERDTVITCANGTILAIPAKSFAVGDSNGTKGIVTLVVKEFYDYADMMAARLTTVSNGEQLISGGMVYLSAQQDGKEVTLAPGRNIAVKMPVTKKFDPGMQLFTTAAHDDSPGMDTTSGINWIPAGQSQRLKQSKFMIKIFDPYGQPFSVKEKKNGKKVAKFVVRANCTMKNRDILEALKGHYGMFYDKIKLRRSLSDEPGPLFSKKQYPAIGDSMEIDYFKALKMNILSKEEIARYEAQFLADSLAANEKLNSISFYEFQLSNLGYFNCDRFAKIDPKVNFAVWMKGTEPVQNIYSVLAFDDYRSVVRGYNGQQMIQFANVPRDANVHLISVGVKEGRIVSSIQPFTITGKDVYLEYTETTPLQFREQLKELHLK